MRMLRLALAVTGALWLGGCFDLVQEYWFAADGSARVVVDVAVPKALLHLAGRDPVLALREEASRVEAQLKADPAVTAFRFSDRKEADAHHLRWELEVTDATKLPELYRRALAQSEVATDGPAPDFTFTVERTVLGDTVFAQRLVPAEGGSVPDAQTRDFGRQLAGALMGERFVTVRVRGPGIGESNGTLSEDGTAVEWRIPLKELMVDAAAQQELRAVVKTRAPLWLWAVVLGVPSLLLWAAVSGMKRRRRAGAEIR